MMLGRRCGVGLLTVVLAVLLLPKGKAEGLHFPVLKDLELNEAPDNKAHLLYTPAANQDRILDLPGLDFVPGFNQFSGYLTVSQDNGRRIFYWYVESQRDPKNDPVVFWTNGGPGCSGLIGFGAEHGPFFMEKDGKLSPNPHSWNTVASMLYVEQPAGVGFSYSETQSDYETNDQKAASDMYVLIREFLARFPERKGNDFYIASESYGGHYMPQLAKEILTRNTDGFINFRGFMVGNPYVDPYTNTLAQFQAFYSHSLIAKPLYDAWVKTCSDPNSPPVTCEDLKNEMYSHWGNSINRYALDYPVCREKNSRPSSQAMTLLQTMGVPVLSDEDVYHPCETEHLIKYLNRKEVQTALHAKTGTNWTICAKGVVHYHKDGLSKVNLYKELVKMGMKREHRLNMLVYSGDDDSVCSTAGTQAWIYDLGVDPLKEHLWRAWKVNEQTAGYVTHFDLGSDADATFTFATVHGAGHEVPAFRPVEALEMFKIYLRGEW